MATAPAMKITAIAPWFGGKRTLAPRIVAELGKHSAYWEPFCGGLSVLLAKPPSSHETVNDLHGDLINLARVIACPERAPVLYGRLSSVLFDEQRRGDSLAALAGDLGPTERAFHWMIVEWFGRNGFSGTVGSDKSSFAVRWTPNGGHGGQRFQSAVESIPAWHHRLRRVTILQRNAREILDSIDDHPNVVVYLDPPYIDKAARYVHDFAESSGLFANADGPLSHDELAEKASRFKRARVVISYYDHPKVRELYQGWTFVDCTMSKGLHNAGRRGQEGTSAPEILIVNGPSLTSK